ncbi:superoxide dismutase family protein [Gracilibacillus dipsosauri]|uniref:Superoxide dismutase [Cu-Zn] n=1 Tax=Gracilibacillus dipsosauri TaxID=178340 RepID=A0A317KZY8_9BACI|nr:superoxide dismutase family protein [Gracilibacillus dipsosauri]PWU68128.1 superoxide dismutase [Gracilibacillus dipsosauri]
MKRFPILLFIFSLCILSACKDNTRSPLEVRLYNADNDAVGTATFKEQADKVTVHVTAEGLTPGFHGIHIHEYPACEGPDFQTAGNHFNPKGKDHGLMNPKGAHLGDMPNIEADPSGAVDVELDIPEATLMDGNTSLLRENGTSIIIHEKQDDGISQPAGDAGNRVVCGVISLDESNQENKPTDPTEVDKEEEKKGK